MGFGQSPGGGPGEKGARNRVNFRDFMWRMKCWINLNTAVSVIIFVDIFIGEYIRIYLPYIGKVKEFVVKPVKVQFLGIMKHLLLW